MEMKDFDKLTVVELKNLIKYATDDMEDLKNNYVEIEKLMRSNASIEDKLEVAETKYPRDEDIFEIDKQLNKSIKDLNKVFGKEVVMVAFQNEKVKDEYNKYLYMKEDAEYMYPHARGAVDVFIRDNCLEMNK